MKTYYQPSTSPFALAGVQAISMSDEHYEQLKGKVDFLDAKSKEVQAYLAAVAERDAAQALAAQAAEDAADEAEALAEIVKEQFAGELAKRIKERKAKRQAERKAAKGK